MAEPDRPPGQRSLFNFGVRVAEKRPPRRLIGPRSSAMWRPSGQWAGREKKGKKPVPGLCWYRSAAAGSRAEGEGVVMDP